MLFRRPLILITLIILSSLSIANAQLCATDELHQTMLQDYPVLQSKWQQSEKAYSAEMNMAHPKLASTYIIPVVVHIIHNNGSENISDEQVIQGIEHLNQAFENIAPYDPATGVDMDIEFCLAQRDPDGNATTGINRVVSSLTQFNYNTQDLAVKNLSRWNPLEYVNIWLVRDICGNFGCSVAGYAYFPSAHGLPIDGIVMEAGLMGNSPGSSAVLAHEMGHYLGLYHTFEGGCTNYDCLSNGDRICDTPPDASTAGVPCDFSVNSCSTDTDSGFPTDQDDMFWNYMDYGDWDCYSAFTEGQRDRAQFFLTGVRTSLLSSQGCLDPCSNPISTNFTVNNTTINIDETINFDNSTTGATTFDWLIDGVSFSNANSPSYTFNSLGIYTITLVATNGDPNCDSSFELEINVVCPVNADFTPSNYYPVPGESVTFTNSSQNATSYNWTIDGVPFSSNTNIINSFAEGIYTICLAASGGSCGDEHCATVWVFPEEDTDPTPCEDTYIRNFGSDDDERGTILVDIPDGFLVGGEKGDSTLIVRLDINGKIVWSRTFDFTPASEAPSDAVIDSDGNLVIVGWGGSSTRYNYAFKYDYEADNVIWTRLFSNPINSAFREVVEKSVGGTYYILGQSGTNSAPGQGCDALFLEVDRDTGAKITEKNFNNGACDAFNNAVVANNSIYVMGIYALGSTSGTIRPGITRLDLSGNIIWSNYYIASANQTARLYGADLVVENNAIYGAGRGDLNGESPTNISNYLFKTDLAGNIEWAVNYNLTSGNNERITDMVSVPDGFLIKGYYDEGGTTNSFLLKVTKEGDIPWAKSYANSFNTDYAPDMVIKNNYIYTTGGTADNDILLTKFNAENGELDDPCAAVDDLSFNQTILTPFGTSIQPNEFTLSITLSAANISPTSTQLDDGEICSTPCLEVCDNGVDDDEDGLIDCLDDDCPDCESDCEEPTFLRKFSSDDIEEAATIVSVPTGIIVGGSKGDSTLLTHLDDNGYITWAKTFKFSTTDEALQGLVVDSDGNIMGGGFAVSGSNRTNYTFKYNYLTDNLIWANTLNAPSLSIYRHFLEKAPNDNYYVFGEISATGCDATVIELDRNTGNIVADYSFEFGTCETFRRATIYNQELYLTGRYTAGSDFGKMRPAITKMSLSGDEIWSRLYLVNPNATARIYARDIMIENDAIYNISRGDLSGTSLSDATFHLQKNNLNGITEWAKSYNIPNGNTEHPNSIISLPDGFLINGFYTVSGNNTAVFLLKTDKEGNVQWSKSYDFTMDTERGNSFANYLVIKNNAIYIAGHMEGDIIIAKLDVQGNLSDDCLTANDITVTENDITNPYDGTIDLTELNLNLSLNNVNVAPSTTNFDETQIICSEPCEICDNGIDDDEDGLIDCLDDDCPDCVPDCEQPTFLRVFGSDDAEQAGALIKLPDGGFIIGGSKADEILFIRVNENGTVEWSRTLNFTDYNSEILNHLMLDSDGNLVGSGQSYTGVSNNRVIFTFKYNYLTDNVLWANLLENPTQTFFYTLLEKNPGENYLATGQSGINSSPGLGCDALLLELDRNTGTKVAEYNYNLGSCETFQRATIYNNNLYVTGRYNNAGGGASEMRTSISQLTLSGEELWSRLYLNNTNTVARTYSSGILVENDAIYVLSYGDLSGTNTANVTYHLYKTNLDGNIEWAKNYNIQIANNERPNNILSMPDGFLISGNYNDNNNNNNLQTFLMKTDKQGNIQWSKSYDFSMSINPGEVVFKDGFIYITGSINSDIVWARLDLNGNFIVSCESIEELSVSQSDIPNPYDGTRNLSEFNLNLSLSDIDPSTNALILEEEDVCGSPCIETCDNNIDDDGDGLADCEDPDCACTDACLPDVLTLELGANITVCENGVHTFDAGAGHDQYIWQDGSTEQTFTAYEAGMYTVTVIDSCDVIQTDSVQLLIESVSEINFDDVTLCPGDSITLTVAGQFFDSFTWLPNEGLSCNDCATVIVSPTQTTEYQIIATTELGCITVDTFLVEILLNLETNVINQASCNEICDGSASVSPLAGTPPFTYVWSNGATDSIAVDLCVGTYSVTVTDADNCTSVSTIELGADANINADFTTLNPTCFGDVNGVIVIENLVGGTPPYAYSLDGETYSIDNAFYALAAGTYNVYIQDAMGCISVFEATVTQPDELVVDLGLDVTIRFADSTQLFAQTNTIDSIDYMWFPADDLSCTDCPDPIASNLDTTTYYVTISDVNGCQAFDSIRVNVDKRINVFIPTAFSPNGDGVNDTFIVHGGGGVTGVSILSIYDRWGELVFENTNFPVNDHSKGWNGRFKGKRMSPAVFVYYTEVEFFDGTSEVYKGEFTLLR